MNRQTIWLTTVINIADIDILSNSMFADNDDEEMQVPDIPYILQQ